MKQGAGENQRGVGDGRYGGICKEKVGSKKELDSLKMVFEGLRFECHFFICYTPERV